MGGLIVGRTLAPSLEILLLTNGRDGVQLPADLILLQNPALDALASWQFIDFLKRSNAYVELRSSDGESFESPRPIIVSITSEVDSVTATSYPYRSRRQQPVYRIPRR